jgi:hypothetical protein
MDTHARMRACAEARTRAWGRAADFADGDGRRAETHAHTCRKSATLRLPRLQRNKVQEDQSAEYRPRQQVIDRGLRWDGAEMQERCQTAKPSAATKQV